MGSGADLFVMPESREPSFPESASEFYTELQQSINARLAKRRLKFIIDDEKHRDQLKNKGFGEKEDSEYVLKPYEALYLIYTKKLIIKDRDNTVDFDGLVRTILKRDKNILTRFMVYRDLRSRGYIPKEGFGFGVDFRVYERGEYEKKPAKYVVFGISEGTKIKADKLAETIEQITRMGKDAVVAVIERRGEVIYYKMSKVAFPSNEKVAEEPNIQL
ncbi:MAG TPA: tRNA-intron lyase [Nitrososphaeraceae archaeon]|jgi:tRNA-intron endonuclease|nr:tRNA-intron lyase [Nitrososphaeraceae archaeon]